jgi:hypothetical protein
VSEQYVHYMYCSRVLESYVDATCCVVLCCVVLCAVML